MGKRPSLFSPHVERYLLADEGEVIVDEVVKHSVCMIVPVLITLGGIVLMVASAVASWLWPLLLFPGVIIAFIGLGKYHSRSMERFVITTMRVFTVSGVVHRRIETMPLTRILNISMSQPLLGMVFNYGHFVFESSADQGLRKVTYVGDPKERDVTIQRVIHQGGRGAIARPQTVSAVRLDDGA